jgi:hypothetical protein
MMEHRAGGVLAPGTVPSLGILPVDAGYALAWLAEVTTASGREVCALDARDGELLMRSPAGHEQELAGFVPADTRGEIAAVTSFYANTFGARHIVVGDYVHNSGAPLRVVAHVMTHDAVGGPASLVNRGEADALGEAYANLVEAGVIGADIAGLREPDCLEIQKVFYRAFVYMLPSGGGLSVAHAATMQSARDLFGDDARVAKNVAAVWAALGLGASR